MKIRIKELEDEAERLLKKCERLETELANAKPEKPETLSKENCLNYVEAYRTYSKTFEELSETLDECSKTQDLLLRQIREVDKVYDELPNIAEKVKNGEYKVVLSDDKNTPNQILMKADKGEEELLFTMDFATMEVIEVGPKRDYRSFKKMELESSSLLTLENVKTATPSKKGWQSAIFLKYPELQEPLKAEERAFLCKIDEKALPRVNKQGIIRKAESLSELNNAMVTPELNPIQSKIVKAVYSIMWDRWDKGYPIDVNEVSINEFAELVGYKKSPNIKSRDRENVYTTIEFFATTSCYRGVILDKMGVPTTYTLLDNIRYNKKTGLLKFSSPYFEMLINTMVKESKKQEVLNKYAKKSLQGKNPIVFAFVSEVLQTIVTSGGKPNTHLALMSVINRNQEIKKVFEMYDVPMRFINNYLPNVYKSLREDTYLLEKFPNIILPNESNINDMPTAKTYKNMVYRFF